ncbi:hypothetical protein ACFLWI_07770 [Chloroflexota bacterium]
MRDERRALGMLSDTAVSGALNLFANNHSWWWTLPGETRVLGK